MSRSDLNGIVPPVATPITPEEAVDESALIRLVEFQIEGGVHGLWALGTTARFDLVTDRQQRTAAEIIAEANDGRLPLVLNISDMGTLRTLERAKQFDDLPYHFYAALPPWYQPLRDFEVLDYFRALADQLAKPLVIYNAPWVCNQLSLDHLRALAEHPRIVGVKDVTPSLLPVQAWPADDRKAQNFTYLQGCDLLGNAAELGADGFVPAMANVFPELASAVWEAAQADDPARTFRLQTQWSRLTHALSIGPTLACLEAAGRFRGLFDRMLPAPMKGLDEPTADRVIQAVEAVGYLPEPAPECSTEPLSGS